MEADRALKVAVIGGGITGLAAAWKLKSEGVHVQLFEPGSRPGGWVHSTERDGCLLEWGPHSVLPRSPNLIQLAREVGLHETWVSADSKAKKRYVYRAGRLRSLPTSPLGIPFSRALSPFGWWRVLMEPFQSAQEIPEESVKEFFHRRLGKEAAHILADSMVAGISGGIPESLELESFAPKVKQMERDHGSLFSGILRSSPVGGVPFKGTGTLRGGMQSLTDALARDLGDRYQGSVPVTDLYRSGSVWNLAVEGAYQGDTSGFDAVILASPAAQAARILSSQSSHLCGLLDTISYAPMVLVQIAYAPSESRFSPDGFGFLVPRGQGMGILGAIWSSTIFPWRSPSGTALATVFMGGVRDPEVVDRTDEEIRLQALESLKHVYGEAFRPQWIEIKRAKAAIPQQQRGHSRKVAAIRHSLLQLPGVELAGGYLDGISLENCATSGIEAASRILQNASQ